MNGNNNHHKFQHIDKTFKPPLSPVNQPNTSSQTPSHATFRPPMSPVNIDQPVIEPPKPKPK